MASPTSCPNCQNVDPKIRRDVAGIVVERCTYPVHADYARSADADYRAAFKAIRQAELDAERRAPKSKAIGELYWELEADEYDQALEAVGLGR